MPQESVQVEVHERLAVDGERIGHLGEDWGNNEFQKSTIFATPGGLGTAS